MNKKFVVSWLAVFVAWYLGSFLVHGVLLSADYMRLQNLFRSPDDSVRLIWLMILAHIIMAGAFTWIYLGGREAKPWLAQGVRYGIAIALLTVVPTYLIYYVVQPMPIDTVVKQVVFDAILIVLLGVLVAWVNRAAPATS